MKCFRGVEPYYYERGFDLYADGGNYAAASLLYLTGPTLLGEAEFDELLLAFQLAVKAKSPVARIRLISAARNLRWQEYPELLGPLANMHLQNVGMRSLIQMSTQTQRWLFFIL